MRLEKQEEERQARRKGLTWKTIIQLIWFLISLAIAYVLISSLESEGVFTYAQLYRTFSIPVTIPQWAVQWAMMLIIAIVMQFILFLAFAFTSREGRRRPGDPSLHSRHKDPFDQKY